MRVSRSLSILFCLAASALSAQSLIITLSTSANSLQGSQTATLTALVTGDPNAAVTWSFAPNFGRFTTAGTGPNASGISTIAYQAPALVTNAQTITVTATSVADPTQAASVFIQLTPLAVTVRVSPATVSLTAGQTQQFSAAVSGVSVTGVTWSLGTQVGSIDPATGLYTAPATITANQNVSVIATSVFNGTSTGTATVTLQAPPSVTVSVSPATFTLSNSQTQQFSATVLNAASTAVTWTISPQTGTIDQTGLYTAPATITGTPRITVTATSVADPTKTGSAVVTLQAAPVVGVTVSPATVALVNSQMQQFTATVTNATSPAVTWTINPLIGAIDQNGLYTAPVTIVGTPRITVTATSTFDVTKSGTAVINLSTVIDVGTGAPTPALVGQFFSAYQRNGFSSLVSLPPIGQVKALGTAGYVQEFQDAAKDAGVKLALATASPTAVTLQPDGSVVTVFQILASEYAYYLTVGATTAGYPLEDTMGCPFFDAANSCTYQFFDKGYALFAYANPLPAGQNFTIRLAFYTEWTKLGGISGPGRPIGVETAITASTATTATAQTYGGGAIYTITSGTNKNLVFGVTRPIYDLYISGGGPAGPLGLPTGELTLVSPTGGGVYRQLFEKGVLQFTGNGTPIQLLPVTSVVVTGAPTGNTTTTTLNLGQTLTLTASPMDSTGTALTDRPVSWSTTNGKAISIQPSGLTAVITAIGAGSANVTASSSGVTSATVKLLVIAPCCQVGDGAPQSVQQAFQNALTRNGINVQLPVAAPAGRTGNGYVQTVQSGSATYLLADGDQASSAFVVSGAVLAQYMNLGGPAGVLGYPVSDQSAGGTQRFANGTALAGNPVHLVSGPVLAKWAQLGYETGGAGVPVAEPAAFTTFGANSGVSQAFSGGAIYAATAGPRSGQTYFVSGLILTAYNAAGAAAGSFGMAVSDEFVTGALHQQNFEGGNFTYSVGDAAAQTHAAPKTPAVIVAPSSITAGGSVELAISGFANNTTIRVSVSGHPDFLVTTASGAYSWTMFIPLAATSGTVAIHAADTRSVSAADGVLTIKGLAANRIQLVKMQGDNQTGSPGALLPVPLRVKLADAGGTPVVGAQVVFQASPGAQLSAVGVLTDTAGMAQTFVRLPSTSGTAIVTASSPSVAPTPVDFYALAAATNLSNFPNLRQTGKGALLTAVASILQYRQNRGELPSPNGAATAATLSQFLSAYCSTDVTGNSLCDGFLTNPNSGEQIVNLWRAVNFTGGVDVSVENPALATVADFVAQGEPLLLSLGLSLNGTVGGGLAGGHYVVATGIAADGSIVIQDPNPLFARTNLNDYLNGFTAGSGVWKANLLGVVRFPLRSPSPSRFLLAALSQPASLMASLALDVNSVAGACGTSLQLLDSVDASGTPPSAGPLVSRIRVCDGLQAAYQIGVGSGQAYQAFVTDLAQGGASVDVSGTAPAAFTATRPLLNLMLAPVAASFTAAAVVNAATFMSGIAPGGLIAIFGSGLQGAAAPTTVSIDGVAAAVIAATPFQVNAALPLTTAPGAHTLRLTSAYGTSQQTVNVTAVAPGIFLLGGNPAAGAVVNADGSVNSPANPLSRGQYFTIYATGLGAVIKQGLYSVTGQTVTVVLNGTELPVLFAGLTPGYTGLYQVNVVIPAATPPGLSLTLSLKEGGQLSNVVSVAIQ